MAEPLAIAYAPRQVRRHGLSEAHAQPLVSEGKHGRSYSTYRTYPKRAWRYPELELTRSAGAYTALTYDLDSATSHEDLAGLYYDGKLPLYSWMVINQTNGHLHATWALKTPVLRGSTARLKPLRFLARVSEYYRTILSADTGYTGVLSHNPCKQGQRGTDYMTVWGAKGGYSLQALGSFIPLGWRSPPKPDTAIGRNVGLFTAGMQWAGQQANATAAVLTMLLSMNADLEYPLGMNEVTHIAKHIETYREQWAEHGWHSTAFRAKQRARALIQGKQRRAAVQERNETIQALAVQGWRKVDIAKHFGLSRMQIHSILKV